MPDCAVDTKAPLDYDSGRWETLVACGAETGKSAQGRWASCDLHRIEVRDHAGFGLRLYRDIVVRCLLGCY